MTHWMLPADDGYSLHVQHYPAATPVKGHLACIHGIQSHAGWYAASGEFFARHGFEVHFLDRRGSGQNQQERGHCQNVRQLLDDLRAFMCGVRERADGRPVILQAISWGGKLAVELLADEPHLVDAIMFVCPGWHSQVAVGLSTKLAVAGWNLINPKHRLPIPLNDPQLFTANPAKVAFLRQDPLSLHEGSARLLLVSRLLDRRLRRRQQIKLPPCLLLLAGRDRIIDNAQTRSYFDRIDAVKQVIEYPTAHHTLEFEPDPQPIFNHMLVWLNACVLTMRS